MTRKSPKGFTLVETVVGLGLLLIVMGAVLGLYYSSVQAIGVARARITAISLANEQLELARNLPYAQVGTTTGWPSGALQASRDVTRNGLRFTITTNPKYVDDPFDGNALGTIPNKPADTQPSDYKLVEVRVCWSTYPCLKPVAVSTSIVPKGVEAADGTGSLYIKALDANGLPVGQATVRVTNTTTVPVINITSSTDNDGNLLLSSLPPALSTYHIEVEKNGYNDDYTLPVSGGNPNPVRPDTSVVASSVTALTFFVDHLASLGIRTVDQSCSPIPNVDFSLRGQLLDGTPSVYRYDQLLSTNAFGILDLTDLHWDTYTLTLNAALGYDIAGTTISQPFSILPGSDQTVYLHLAPAADHTLLVTVRDSGTQVPLSDATVRVENFSGYDETKTTGKGTISQSDWSGGSGQNDFSDTTRFFAQDGNLDTSQPNLLRLSVDTSTENVSEDFSTDAQTDYAATTADWNTALGLGQLQESFGTYDPTGILQTLGLTNSGIIRSATLHAAEELNGQTITYELSVDGGATFELVTNNVLHTFASPGTDLRLRANLATSDTAVTPQLLGFTLDLGIDVYRSSGELTSSTMNLGPGTAFDALQWLPLAQPPEAGDPSVAFQIATNTDQATWNFVGPDGTAGTFYTTSGDTIWSGHAGDQYLRYRVTLSTADPRFSPTVTNISILHSSGCVPPGQSFFSPLNAETYQITVNRAGYEEYINSIPVSGDTSVVIDVNAS